MTTPKSNQESTRHVPNCDGWRDHDCGDSTCGQEKERCPGCSTRPERCDGEATVRHLERCVLPAGHESPHQWVCAVSENREPVDKRLATQNARIEELRQERATLSVAVKAALLLLSRGSTDGAVARAEAEAIAGDLLDEWMVSVHELLESVATAFARTVRNGAVPPNNSDPDGGLDKMRSAYRALHEHPVAVAAYKAAGKLVRS